MSPRTLRWLGVLLPVLFWTVVVALRIGLGNYSPTLLTAIIELTLVAIAGAFFADWVANRFDEHAEEMDRRAQQLDALREAALTLTTEVELSKVLQGVADVSRKLVGARYAALGVLDGTGSAIEQFYTAGLSADERARIGSPPVGNGLLGVIMTERRPLLVHNISADPRSVGFPPHHPPMHTLLGVPIASKGRTFGNLYLTDKLDESSEKAVPFSEQDQQTLQMFAAHAAVAIENAQLYRQNRQIAIMQERERFGMNLHDGVIQSIYALGLLLDDAQHRVEDEPDVARERIVQTMRGLNDVIRDIRSYIMDLRPQRFEGRTLEQALQELVEHTAKNFQMALSVEPSAANVTTPKQTAEVLHIVQEALTNIRKHAHAQQVIIRANRVGGRLQITITDDGRGFDVFQAARSAGGNGLRNMQQRVRSLDGEFEIDSQVGQGARIAFSIPISSKSRALG
jgi:signal transduction histidine kinase